ncbi:MAG: hypothetical protein M1825_006044 [Sarcosagium campestre]|nr:MAG: hypothetical protein M1825_006044 [Sarcosagium campestre]
MARQEKGLEASRWAGQGHPGSRINKAGRSALNPLSNIVLQPGEKLSIRPHRPPPGYTYVPKGDVYVTRNCRTKTKDAGRILYVVFSQSSRTQLGLHVPSDVAAQVSQDAEDTADSREKAVAAKDHRAVTEARNELLRLYPRIPLKHAEDILSHAFLKGSGRVGRSGTLGIENKVVLATVSHVRHRMTDYDQLLRNAKTADGVDDNDEHLSERRRASARLEARRQVKKQVQDIIEGWQDVSTVVRQGRPTVGGDVKPEKDQVFPRQLKESLKDFQLDGERDEHRPLKRRRDFEDHVIYCEEIVPQSELDILDPDTMDWIDDYLGDGGTDDEDEDDGDEWPDAMDLS